VVKIDIYTSEFCPFCDRAKRLLRQKGVEFQEHLLDHLTDEELRIEMAKLSGQRTVPQIVIGGNAIGGWSELSELDRTGQLDALLAVDPEDSGPRSG